MATLINLTAGFLSLLDSLSIFFFSPLGSLASTVSAAVGSSVVLDFLLHVVSGLLVIAPFLASVTLAELLLCGGVIFFLAIRLITFLVPILK